MLPSIRALLFINLIIFSIIQAQPEPTQFFSPSTTSSSTSYSYPPATLSLKSSGLHDPIGSVQGLITRLLGSEYLSSFQLNIIPSDPLTNNDVFEISSGNNGTVIINGNAGYSIAAGLNWYLKYTLNISISWGRRNPLDNRLTGNNLLSLPLPNQFPAPKTNTSNTTIRIVSPVKIRYAYNVCTYGYTFTFWNFTQFEEEIDRIALWGVNTPLAFHGQESLWYQFYQQNGFNMTLINEYFTGPAFLPWGRMGNIQNWGGPLNDNWYTQQQTLQLAILTVSNFLIFILHFFNQERIQLISLYIYYLILYISFYVFFL